jgi:hypothetical protein
LRVSVVGGNNEDIDSDAFESCITVRSLKPCKNQERTEYAIRWLMPCRILVDFDCHELHDGSAWGGFKLVEEARTRVSRRS